MSRTVTTETLATRDAPHLDDFFATVRDRNPFAVNRVTEPSPDDIDVPAIHAASFDRLVDLAHQSLRDRSGVGALLLGGAGVGKSHLLSRLYRWAKESDPEGSPRACYVYLHNLLASPDRLPRLLLKSVVSRLAQGGRGPLYETPLFLLIDRAIRRAHAASGAGTDPPADIIEAHRTYRAAVEPTTGSRDVSQALFQFLRHARPEKAGEPGRRRLALEAIAWLSGDPIDPQVARHLGLRAVEREPAMLRDDHEVEQVLLALGHLARIGHQPFVVCLDQVDNIDPDKLKPLARFLHALIDHAENLLVITSGVKASLLNFKDEGVIPEAAWDRLARHKVELQRVSPEDAQKILEARLERFLEPFLTLDPVRRHLQEDTLFPLGRAWLVDQLAGGLEFRPRDILTWAGDAWDEQRSRLAQTGGEAWLRAWPDRTTGAIEREKVLTPAELDRLIDDAVEQKIEERIAEQRHQPGILPPYADNLATLVESLLEECQGDHLPYTFRTVERMQKKGGKLPPFDLLVRERREGDGREVTTGVLFVTNDGLSATAALRRLLEHDDPLDHRLLVTDEERRPLDVGPQGLLYYRDLEDLGAARFEHLKLDFAQYAELDALREVIALARSGDFEIEAPPGTIRPITEDEVVASHHRRDRFRRHPLLRPLLTEDTPPLEDASCLSPASARLATDASLG